MNGDLARTYTLIHAFLVKHAHLKAAQALKNSVKNGLILKDNAIPKGPSLEDIIRSWKARLQDEDQKDSDSSSSSSDSSSSSSSNSSSSSSSSSNPSSKIKRGKPVKKIKPPSSSSSKSSSGSGSEIYIQKTKIPDRKSSKVDPSSVSDGESSVSESPASDKAKTMTLKCEHTSSCTLSSNDLASDTSKKKPPKPTIVSIKEKRSKASLSSVVHANKVKVGNKINQKHEKASSPCDASSDSGEDSNAKAEPIPKIPLKAKVSSSSSSSEDSDSEPQPTPGSKKINAVKVSTAKEPAPIALKSNLKVTTSSQDAKTRVTKKRRVDAEGNSVATASVTIPAPKVREQSQAIGKTGNDPHTTNNRFTRLNSSKIQPSVDNSYVAKNAPTNDYGKRAHQDLIVTRGAGFRKEKNKKKRGSYRGGEITMESHSFKFT